MQRENSLTRQIHDLVQGSPDWHQFRLEHDGASEAAAALGLSTKTKRSELIRMKATGLGKEFSDWVQENILDYGHQVEALARPIVEGIIGDDLYPVTCSLGHLSASCDGLTMSEAIAFEHKQWNSALAASISSGVLPDDHAPQCQQILMVTGAEKLIFVVSDGTAENMVHMWVYPDTAWFDRIVAGWEQFDLDVAAYVPTEIVEKPAAEVIMALPALVVQTRGEVVQSNLPAFQAAATAFIAKIKTDLATDEDFANAEATVKFCSDAERDLEATKASVLGQAATIDTVMKTIDNIKEQLRSKRLVLEKLVVSKKQLIKEGILAKAKDAYTEHVAALEVEIKPLRLTAPVPDFAGAMKNKRTLASLQDAVDTLLANAKISTNTTAADYRAKQAWCKENAAGHGALFMDMAQIIAKPMDDFQLVVTTRVSAHLAAEEKKAADLRAEIEAKEKVRADAVIAEAARLAQIEADNVAAAAVQAERDRVAAETKAQLEEKGKLAAAERTANDQAIAKQQAATRESALAAANASIASAAAANVVAAGQAVALADHGHLADLATDLVAAGLFADVAPADAARTPPTLRLGQIGERLCFTVTADFLLSLGFAPAATDKAAKLYHDSDFPRICAAMQRHIDAVRVKYAA
jgi:predicted phage-related endonuclease